MEFVVSTLPLRRLSELWPMLGLVVGLRSTDASAAQTDRTTSSDVATPTIGGHLDAGVFAERTAQRDAAAVSPHVGLAIRARPEVELLFAGGVATLSQSEAGTVSRHARAANLLIGMRFVRERRSTRWVRARLGMDFALPTGFALGEDEAEAVDLALASRGGWSPWQWSPAMLGLVVPAEIRAQVMRRWVLGVDAGVAGLFSASDQPGFPGAVAQLAGEARFVAPWLGAGVRLQGIYNGRNEVDTTQAAVVPFVDASLCRKASGRRVRGVMGMTDPDCPVFAVARMHVNLDAPYGFIGSEAARVWGLQLALGWAVY